ncbi:hypothetical protein PROH_11755 [Prochlorothrix hollandica PCC 9006 = CALU 1027]|uniref:Uncharacterized protein n=1 Tax=Prochlorothrix hollandica PCC 9006 = CALU 1027 TaxID=317619 RepID=A0A0M2Q074_PROHO|nr:hypothetical protein PROH_11755 [Prochlorothrix hollandica PCC 9006 = CALU 1027]
MQQDPGKFSGGGFLAVVFWRWFSSNDFPAGQKLDNLTLFPQFPQAPVEKLPRSPLNQGGVMENSSKLILIQNNSDFRVSSK